jgi:hypothetical protein
MSMYDFTVTTKLLPLTAQNATVLQTFPTCHIFEQLKCADFEHTYDKSSFWFPVYIAFVRWPPNFQPAITYQLDKYITSHQRLTHPATIYLSHYHFIQF